MASSSSTSAERAKWPGNQSCSPMTGMRLRSENKITVFERNPVIDIKLENEMEFIGVGPSSCTKGWRRIPAITFSTNAPPDAVLDIPFSHNTKEVVIFCGLNDEAASEALEELHDQAAEELRLHKRSDSQQPWPVRPLVDLSIVEIALERMERAKEKRPYREAWGKGNWVGALLALNVSKQMIRAIMDPRFRVIRVTGTPYQWARDSVSNNLCFLEDLPRRITERKGIVTRIVKAKRMAYRPSITPRLGQVLGQDEEARDYFRTKNLYETYLPIDINFGLIKHRYDPRTTRIQVPNGAYMFLDQNQDYGKENMRVFLNKDVADLIALYRAARLRSREAGILYIYLEGDTFVQEARPNQVENLPKGSHTCLTTTVKNDDFGPYVFRTRVVETGLTTATKFWYRPERVYTKQSGLDKYRNADILFGPVCGYTDDLITSNVDRPDDLYPLLRPGGGSGEGDSDDGGHERHRASQFVFVSQEAREDFENQIYKTMGLGFVFDNESHLAMTQFDKDDLMWPKRWDDEGYKGWNGYRWKSIHFPIEGHSMLHRQNAELEESKS